MENKKYLGHQISSLGVRPGKLKTEAVVVFNANKCPQNPTISWPHKLFQEIPERILQALQPLTSLTRKNISLEWEDAQNKPTTLKATFVTRPILVVQVTTLKSIHMHRRLALDALPFKEQPNGQLMPIAYFSRQTTKDEAKYHSYELKTLAVVTSLQRFRVYLVGVTFKVVTDCVAIRTTLSKRDQDYNFTLEYRPGEKMKHADALSRNPMETVTALTETKILMANLVQDDWLLSAQLKDDNCRQLIKVLKGSGTTKRK